MPASPGRTLATCGSAPGRGGATESSHRLWGDCSHDLSCAANTLAGMTGAITRDLASGTRRFSSGMADRCRHVIAQLDALIASRPNDSGDRSREAT